MEILYPIATSKADELLARIQEAGSLTVYRATNDVLPVKLVHLHPGDGIFGPGTYFGLTRKVAMTYVGGGMKYATVVRYKVDLKDPLSLTASAGTEKGQQVGISYAANGKRLSLEGTEIDRDRLSFWATAHHHDGIVMRDSGTMGYSSQVDGGEQLLIPRGAKPTVTPEGFDLVIDPAQVPGDLDSLIKDLEALGGKKEASNDRKFKLEINGFRWSAERAVSSVLLARYKEEG